MNNATALTATTARLNLTLAELNAAYLRRLALVGKANADAFMTALLNGATIKQAHLTAEPLAVRN